MIIKIKKKISWRYRQWVELKLPFHAHKNSFFASLYYFLFSDAFRRENKAVLAGKVKHLERNQKDKSNLYLLVRNTHRIEKGLLMRPMRKTFALDYIGETVDAYAGFLREDAIHHSAQQKWFTDVLSSYFETVEVNAKIALEKEKFLRCKDLLNGKESPISSVPYMRIQENFSPITYEQFYALNRQRRSVRWFLDKPVEREKIDKAILAAIQAPSACNRQPFEYRVLDKPELLKKVVDFPMGTKGYAHSIQAFIVVVGNLDAYFSERDRHLIYVDASLANMSLMLALETLGLSSCPINWPDIESREKMMEEFLALSPYQRPIMCIGIGYPDFTGKVAFSEKRSLDQIRKYN